MSGRSSAAADATTPGRRRLWLWTALALAGVAGWDALGLDVALAGVTATAQGFAWKDAPVLAALHQGGRVAAAVALAWLAVGIAHPIGVLARLRRSERVWLLCTTVCAMLLVSMLKRHSLSSCPWDLQVFGGVARHVSHWALGQRDGGPGRCFPAGHASAAFAFLAGYPALRWRAPRAAAAWLAAVLLAGFAFGLVQQLRGAHFLSHTLWTAWLCWTFALVAHTLCFRNSRHAPLAG